MLGVLILRAPLQDTTWSRRAQMRHDRRTSKLPRTGAVPTEIEKTAYLSSSGPFGRALDKLDRFAQGDHAILLQGERGTGKTRLGPEIHRRSKRASGPYVHVNLAAIEREFMLSDLFGHIPGAYTGATEIRSGYLQSANGGTIFLDEIGKASLATQRALLDVVEYKRARPLGSDRVERLYVRFIFAANECLPTLVERGQMTTDFVDRLGHFKVQLPSLRERPEDIPGIVTAALRDIVLERGWEESRIPRPTPRLMLRLSEYDWPGNVRELRDIIELLVTEACGSTLLDESLLVDELDLPRTRLTVGSLPPRRLSAEEVRRVIEQHGGNKSRAAKALAIGRTSLYRILGEAEPDESNEPLNRELDCARLFQPRSWNNSMSRWNDPARRASERSSRHLRVRRGVSKRRPVRHRHCIGWRREHDLRRP